MTGAFAFFSFFYMMAIFAGIAFLVFLIVFMVRFLSLKREHNQLFREYIQVMKEKKHTEI